MVLGPHKSHKRGKITENGDQKHKIPNNEANNFIDVTYKDLGPKYDLRTINSVLFQLPIHPSYITSIEFA